MDVHKKTQFYYDAAFALLFSPVAIPLADKGLRRRAELRKLPITKP